MKTISATILSLLITAAQACASSGAGNGEDFSLMAIGFISFGVLIVLFQFIPGLLLFGGMIAGLFKTSEKKNNATLAGADK